MNEPKFTPGPWFCTCIGHVKECMGDPPKTVAVIPGVVSEAKMSGITEAQANAELVAAAPEMYELLQELLDNWDTQDMDVLAEYGVSISRVLAKARGEV